jgi:hypothetical protein
MAADARYRDFLAEHLPYELAMLHHCFGRFDVPGADWNAFMESFCIHARNLKQFVTNDKGKGNNCVVASDFADFHEPVPPNLTGAFQRLNSQMAHLAKTRTTAAAAKFTRDDAENVRAWLNAALEKFVAGLDASDHGQWAAAFSTAPKSLKVSQTWSATNLPTQTTTSIVVEMNSATLGPRST